jgi:hypothetical protein
MKTTQEKINEIVRGPQKPQHNVVMPILVAITLLYTVVYHVMLFRTLQEDVSEDDCHDAVFSGRIFPPQCFELEVFRDWHKKEAEELLAPEKEEPAEADLLATGGTGKISMVVDGAGQTFADRISEGLAGLEDKFTQLLDLPIYLDIKDDHKAENAAAINQKSEFAEKAPSKPTLLSSRKSELEAVSEQVHQELHAELDQLEHIHSDAPENSHSGPMSFETFHADMEARHKRRAENRARLVQEMAHEMDSLDKHLKDVVSDRKAWESTLRSKYDTTSLTGDSEQLSSQPKASFMSKRLQWPNMPTVHHTRKVSEILEASQKQTVVVSKSDVRHMHWTGKLPKVAAIASLKGDRKHRARMMYFVDNFRLQDYDGEKELVLVYHHKDVAAAELVNRYVNDTSIKAVVAHDKDQEMFPSDPALRYAAWSSDADVIAQWDVDEYHDPSRISLQVRAMAHANRHACILSTTSTSHSQEEESKEIHRVSLMGERSWMKVHWHPLATEESEVVETFKAGEIVELDMQNKALMGNISRVEHIFIETTTALPVAQDTESTADENEGTDFARGMEECLNYDHTKGHESEDVAEKAISEKAGEDVAKKFHNLVKRRRDIIMKLQLLCFQATMEKDTGKRKFMHDHVLEMDQIRAELDKHITNTASLFTGSI